ncbi:YSIRK-type signal peptide-containing protein, partial [Lactobacillus amylovorus]|uniref:GbpC/Spa domain-containing protein n=1 Tax=Lactobacillus amylovorus TaxID=1604 RepID=UPI00232C7600
MVRKKNKMFVDSADRTPHYSLRKLSVGVASVLLSTTLWMGANGSVAHADTINDATVAGKVEKSGTQKDQTQAQTVESTSQASVASAEKQNGEAQKGQAQVPASAERRQASTAGQASAAATEGQKNGSANAGAAIDATTKAKKDSANPEVNSSDAAPHDSQNQAIIEVQHQISSKEGDLSSLANRAEQDGLTVTKEDDKTYADKQEALADLDKQAADIQSKVTKYEAEKAAYDAAKEVYKEDLDKWNDAQSSPHTVKGISQGLSFANEHDASLDVTSVSDKPVKFIKSTAWLGSDGMGVYTDGIYNGGNISKSFRNSDISYKQAEGTGTDKKNWGKTYTGIQLNVGESAVARYTGLKNSVYIDKDGVAHKLSKVQVKYKLNSTTANDGTANIFLSNNPNIALWYGAAGNKNGSVDLTVNLTFYDENGNPITMGKGSNAWLDMSSLNNGATKVEYFAPNGNTTMQIPGSTIVKHDDGWYANDNNEGTAADWDNPTSAHRYIAAAIMELEGNSFHIGQKITRNNVYSWFALDSSLATAYKPVEPEAPEKPYIAWHGVTYEPQKATVTYVDKTTGKTLKSDSLEGDSNADSKYNTKSSIEDYENKGYKLKSDSTNGQNVVFDTDSSVDQTYEVDLVHGTVTVTPDDKNPVKPGDKINPNDPNSPEYQDDVKHDNLVMDAKQTVHYEGAGKNTPEDNVTTHTNAFTRTVTYDKVTGKSTTSEWSKVNPTFDKVDTPVVKGYTADKKQAGGLTATPDDPEVKDTV